MKIVIAHLYYDLLNLYGESGNITVLKSSLESLGIDVELKKLSITDKLIFKNYDFIYIGSGTENSQMLALKHLMQYKKEIKKAIENKFFLVTGNAFDFFGKYIITKKEQIPCLEIFDYYSFIDDRRYAGEVIATSELFKGKILGFRNSNSYCSNIKKPLFNIEKGIGSNLDSNYEGFNYNNFYGTYMLGPLLYRNPEVLEFIINKIIKNLNLKTTKKPNLSLSIKAHDEYIKNKY